MGNGRNVGAVMKQSAASATSVMAVCEIAAFSPPCLLAETNLYFHVKREKLVALRSIYALALIMRASLLDSWNKPGVAQKAQILFFYHF